MSPVAGVVLAAGASTRMGRNKLLLVLEGATILRRAVSRAIEAGLDPVVVVLGHEAGHAERELAGLRCRSVVNADHALGQGGSLRTGIAALPETAAVVVLLADMPFVTTAMIEQTVDRWRQSGAPLVISDYGGIQAPPTLYHRSLFAELLTVSDEGCAKHLLRRHRDRAVALSWPADAIADLDAPEDLARAEARIAAV